MYPHNPIEDKWFGEWMNSCDGNLNGNLEKQMQNKTKTLKFKNLILSLRLFVTHVSVVVELKQF